MVLSIIFSILSYLLSATRDTDAPFPYFHTIRISFKTGDPAESGLVSVTVIAKSGVLSDALSTACFVLGREDGMKLLEEFDAEGIFIDSDNNITVADGLKDRFTLISRDYTIVS